MERLSFADASISVQEPRGLGQSFDDIVLILSLNALS